MIEGLQCWIEGYHDVQTRYVEHEMYGYTGLWLQEYCQHCQAIETYSMWSSGYIGPAAFLHGLYTWFYHTDFGLLEPLAVKLDEWVHSWDQIPIWWEQ